jgi:Ser-tRNA(Ala) deacylase AlaX
MNFKGLNIIKNIFSRNIPIESDKYGFSKKKLPKLVDKMNKVEKENNPVKISYNNNEEKKKN